MNKLVLELIARFEQDPTGIVMIIGNNHHPLLDLQRGAMGSYERLGLRLGSSRLGGIETYNVYITSDGNVEALNTYGNHQASDVEGVYRGLSSLTSTVGKKFDTPPVVQVEVEQLFKDIYVATIAAMVGTITNDEDYQRVRGMARSGGHNTVSNWIASEAGKQATAGCAEYTRNKPTK